MVIVADIQSQLIQEVYRVYKETVPSTEEKRNQSYSLEPTIRKGNRKGNMRHLLADSVNSSGRSVHSCLIVLCKYNLAKLLGKPAGGASGKVHQPRQEM